MLKKRMANANGDNSKSDDMPLKRPRAVAAATSFFTVSVARLS